LAQGAEMLVVMEEFMKLCGLLGVQGVIDSTHLSILNLKVFLLKSIIIIINGGYNIVAQCVVDNNKKISDVFVGLLGSINDSRVLL
jgi:hypothetical protein